MKNIDNINLLDFFRNLFSNINEQIDTQITKYCNANCDQTRKMKITTIIDSNHYTVIYKNKEYTAYSRFENKVGDVVYVTICCSNFNDLIIN